MCREHGTPRDNILVRSRASLSEYSSLYREPDKADVQRAFFREATTLAARTHEVVKIVNLTESQVRGLQSGLFKLGSLNNANSYNDNTRDSAAQRLLKYLNTLTSDDGPYFRLSDIIPRFQQRHDILAVLLDEVTSEKSRQQKSHQVNIKLLKLFMRSLPPAEQTIRDSLENLHSMKPKWGEAVFDQRDDWRTGFEYPVDAFTKSLHNSTDRLKDLDETLNK